jgi:enamine deaminase RidA (YjgF/YER057c/UK114 family)
MDSVHPAGWPRPRGYANAVIAPAGGRVLAIAGQIGWDPLREEIVSDDFLQQTERALSNLVAILDAAGAHPRHVVRLTWFITDRIAYVAARRELGEAYRRHFGKHYPAMSVLFVAALLEPRAVVEIEATAVIPVTPV